MTGGFQLWIGPADPPLADRLPGSGDGARADAASGQGPRLLAPHDISAERLRALAPAEILCPLTFRGGDAALVAALLARAGWQGRFLVISPPLPAPDMVLAELRGLGPGMDIRLLVPNPHPEPPR